MYFSHRSLEKIVLGWSQTVLETTLKNCLPHGSFYIVLSESTRRKNINIFSLFFPLSQIGTGKILKTNIHKTLEDSVNRLTRILVWLILWRNSFWKFHAFTGN